MNISKKELYDLTVSDELEHLIPPLQEMELSMLTESILANGCEMPLVVWNRTIVDGHNRYRICREHGISFAIEEKKFEDMDAAKVWLIKNQLGRRNLPDFVKCELVVPLEELLKAEAKERQGERTDLTNFPQNSAESDDVVGKRHSKETRDVLAGMAGVSHDTLGKAKKIMRDADEETKDKLRRGEMSIHKAYKKMKETQKPVEATTDIPVVVADIPKPKPVEAEQAMNEQLPIGQQLDTANTTQDNTTDAVQADDQQPQRDRRFIPNTKENKEFHASLDAVIAKLKDVDHIPEYTIDSLIDDLTNNAAPFIRLMRGFLTDRKSVYEGSAKNKKRVKKVIREKVIREIEALMRECVDD